VVRLSWRRKKDDDWRDRGHTQAAGTVAGPFQFLQLENSASAQALILVPSAGPAPRPARGGSETWVYIHGYTIDIQKSGNTWYIHGYTTNVDHVHASVWYIH
jgi:hypothetical protein